MEKAATWIGVPDLVGVTVLVAGFIQAESKLQTLQSQVDTVKKELSGYTDAIKTEKNIAVGAIQRENSTAICAIQASATTSVRAAIDMQLRDHIDREKVATHFLISNSCAPARQVSAIAFLFDTSHPAPAGWPLVMNPQHLEFAQISIEPPELFQFDERLFEGK